MLLVILIMKIIFSISCCLLTNTQVSRLCKAFPNRSSANIKLSKIQLHKIGQSGGVLGRLLGPLLQTGLSLTGKVLKQLAKSILIPLELTAAASTTDAAIHKKMFGSGATALIISNEEMNGVMKIIKSLEESGLLIKGVSENIKNKTIKQRGEFLRMLLGALGASLLGNLKTGKGAIAMSRERGTVRVGEGTFRADESTIRADESTRFLMPLHPLANFKIPKYYQSKPNFNDLY